MTKDEKSLLLYLETCAVDFGGLVDPRHMNAEDFEATRAWNESGYLQFGRVFFKEIKGDRGYWVVFGETAWKDVAKFRRERSDRMRKKIEHKFNRVRVTAPAE